MRFFPGLNRKKLGNSPRFPSVTYSALSDSRFRSYGILKVDFAAELCFWAEEWLNGAQLLGLGLAETPKAPNTITVVTLSAFQWFIIRPHTVRNLRVTAVRNSAGLLNRNSGQTIPFGISQDFDEILP
jgi:hypothetical protein